MTKIFFIYGVVITFILLISIIALIVMNKKKDDECNKIVEEIKKENDEKIDNLIKFEQKKDKLKEEADEKKRKIRTGNKFDNYINGADQLRDNRNKMER